MATRIAPVAGAVRYRTIFLLQAARQFPASLPHRLCYTPLGVTDQHLEVIFNMLFTTGQLRSAFRLSKQQWRSYRDALPPLAKEQGRSGCFTANDLLAASVIHRAGSMLMMPISAFTAIAAPLFDLCAAVPWPQLERSSLLINFEAQRVELIDHERGMTAAPVALLVELAPLVGELRQHLLAGEPAPQRDLAFPPMIAGTRR